MDLQAEFGFLSALLFYADYVLSFLIHTSSKAGRESCGGNNRAQNNDNLGMELCL